MGSGRFRSFNLLVRMMQTLAGNLRVGLTASAQVSSCLALKKGRHSSEDLAMNLLENSVCSPESASG